MKETQTQFLLDIVHIPAITSLFQMKTEECTYIIKTPFYEHNNTLECYSPQRVILRDYISAERSTKCATICKTELSEQCVWCVSVRCSLS